MNAREASVAAASGIRSDRGGRHADRGGRVPAFATVAAPPSRTGVRRAIGREVYHETFGRGVVVDAEGAGEDLKFTVRFRTATKKVLGRFLTGGGDGDSA